MRVQASSRNDKNLENNFDFPKLQFSQQNFNEKHQFLISLYLTSFIIHWNLFKS